ncbi:MAG: hypothetical protein KAR83_02560 [Thermodesulfovibrionales bacterium]|nr:hypothetical protein [Thermodesulfovibrionales bacterium]
MGDFGHILERINDKKADYGQYRFSATEDLALKTFFDLAQELDSLKELYHLCIAIPKSFFDLTARLYLINPRNDKLMLVASPDGESGDVETPEVPEEDFEYNEKGWMVLKVKGKEILLDQLPFKSIGDTIGLLEVMPAEGIGQHLELFFVKYTNRIGFNLHNRFLVEKNIEHLRFISSLVADIEHNIISPNIVYKLYIKNLEASLGKSIEAEQELKQLVGSFPGEEHGQCMKVIEELSESNQSIKREVVEIGRHHKNMSLFLESLLRRSHFDQGRLTLRKKKCVMLREVVKPQLERYYDRLASKGIAVDHQASGIPEEEVVSVVDVGLMAQVYANLLSNVVKYATEVDTQFGRKKYISYGHEIVYGFFGPESDGIKYNVFSTGPHIPPDERERIYEDQYRGSNVEGSPGSGHGLHFIKNVVEIHGGSVGYEPTEFGNNFYFILPKPGGEDNPKE